LLTTLALSLEDHVLEMTASERRGNVRAFIAVASGGILIGLELVMSNAADVDEDFGMKMKSTITNKEREMEMWMPRRGMLGGRTEHE
jgi:hypothetical protein